METIKERLIKFLKYKNMTQQEFETSISCSGGYVSAMDKKKDINAKYKKKIADVYPELNRDWLLHGEGEMLNTAADGATPSPREAEPATLVPLVPISAMGGELINIDQGGAMSYDCEHIPSPVRGAQIAVPVVGDSMAPDYPSGSTVFVKRINSAAFIVWGQVYVLDTENGVLLKEVQQSDRDGFITCISHNNAERYRPFDVPMTSIRAMYRVVASMSLR